MLRNFKYFVVFAFTEPHILLFRRPLPNRKG